MLTGLEWHHKYTIDVAKNSVRKLHWISQKHLAVSMRGCVEVYEVTPESTRLAYKLTSKEWDGGATSVAVSESIPNSILVVCRGRPYVYQYPCHKATHEVKKNKIKGNGVDPSHLVANANTAVVKSYNYSETLTVYSLPDFKHQSQVQINFIPQDLSISADYLLVMGQEEIVLKSLGDLNQDLCSIKPPDEGTIFHCVSSTNNAREIHVVCSEGLSRLSVYKYRRLRCSGSNPSYNNAGIVILWYHLL